MIEATKMDMVTTFNQSCPRATSAVDKKNKISKQFADRNPNILCILRIESKFINKLIVAIWIRKLSNASSRAEIVKDSRIHC